MRSRLPTLLLSLTLAAPATAQDLLPDPAPLEPPPSGRTRFTVDPVADGAILSLGLGFAALSELIIGTGEIQPQQPAGKDRLLAIDRPAVNYGTHPNSKTYSNIGVGIAGAYALTDIVLTGALDGREAGLVDGFIYAESAVLTWAVTNLAKIAVRRPRPRAYQEAARHEDDPGYRIEETDSALSFFSGHTAETAALTSTATYLAFSRDREGAARPWIVLGVGTLTTAFVGWQRVRSGAHFPTDVIAGAMAGAGVGILVPHLHREADIRQRPVWIGYDATQDGTPVVSVGSLF